MITKHFLYGVPGVGKSTIAAQVASNNNLFCIELDDVRPKAQKLVSRDEEPFVYEYSTEAWKRFGKLDKITAVEGFLAVRQAFQKYIAEELSQHGDGYIAEAVYVDPNLVTEDKEAVITLLVTRSEELHYSHFFLHRKHTDEEDSQFRAARLIQEYLIEEAEKLGVKILENNNIDVTILQDKSL